MIIDIENTDSAEEVGTVKNDSDYSLRKWFEALSEGEKAAAINTIVNHRIKNKNNGSDLKMLKF